ncbi:MAG: acyltransferase [Flavobacteriales bacterium]
MKRFIARIANAIDNALQNRQLRSVNGHIGKAIRFNGKAILNIHPKATLEIGDHVVFNSDNFNYHVNMFSACKIMADRPGAVIRIGEKTRIHASCIHAFERIEIGKNVLIAANCQIIDGNGHDASFENVDDRINTTGSSKPVIIEDSVWLATGVVVLPGVRIGRGSIISANSVVNSDIPSMCVAAGNPATVIKQIQG